MGCCRKRGNITRLTRFMNPPGYYVVPIVAPTETRAAITITCGGSTSTFPAAGTSPSLTGLVRAGARGTGGGPLLRTGMEQAYGEINEMEEEYVDSGGGIVKFWLEISRDDIETVPGAAEDPLKVEDNGRGLEEPGEVEPVRQGGERHAGPDMTETAPWTVIESDESGSRGSRH